MPRPTDIKSVSDYTRLVCDSLQRIELSADVRDDGQFVHVTVASKKVFSISHQFLHLASKKNLDYRIRYGAGLTEEKPRRDERLF